MIFSVTLFRSQGRRSVYLAKLLQRRATVEELRERGIIRENAVFGCALEHQTLHSTNTSQVPSLSLICPLIVLSWSSHCPHHSLHCCHLQVPEFLWRCIQKIESKPSYLATEGIYRVPGDASKIQKIRIDIDQVILI